MLVLLSGGQDSTTCLFWALCRRRSEVGVVEAVCFDYGQRHARAELEAAERIAELADVKLYRARISWGGGALASALTTDAPIETRPDGLPSTFVPGRNAVFLSMAAGLAAQNGHRSVVIGASAVDFSGYPDCRPDFIAAMSHALALALGVPDFRIVAPLILESKASTVRMAREIAADLPRCWQAIGMSWTCYLGGAVPCGECPACVLRAKGFAEAGVADPAL